MKIGIAFTVRNCWEYTKACLDSIVTETPNVVLVVDDGSTDITKAELAKYKASFEAGEMEHLKATERFVVITDPAKDSLAGKWNMAVEAAAAEGCEASLICNNDILFHPVTIDTIVNRLAAGDESLGMVTARNVRDSVAKPEDIFSFEIEESPSEAEHPDFSCFLIRHSAWVDIGGFDEGYKPCYFEDNDTHSMFKVMGITAIATTAAPYYHYGSKTQNSVPGGLCKPAEFDKNRLYFIKKFGAKPATLNIERARKRLGLVEGEGGRWVWKGEADG